MNLTMKKLVLIVSFVLLAHSIFQFATVVDADTIELGTETTNSESPVDDLTNRKAEIDEALKTAQEQFETRQKQIAQDIINTQQRSQKRHEDLHNDFKTIQNQMDQIHSNFQTHFNEVTGRVQEDHTAIETQWTQAKEQLDQARADFNKKIADAEKLQKNLEKDRKTIDQNLSTAKNSAQSVHVQLTDGALNAKKAVSDVQDRSEDINGTVNRIKAILNSAGEDFSTDGSRVTPVAAKKAVQSKDAASSQQKNTTEQAKEYPKTNDQSNIFLSLLGFGIIGNLVLYYLRKNHN